MGSRFRFQLRIRLGFRFRLRLVYRLGFRLGPRLRFRWWIEVRAGTKEGVKAAQ